MRRSKNAVTIVILVSLLVISAILATAIGAVAVPLSETVKIIAKNIGFENITLETPAQESIIFYVRFPRVLLAGLVGTALAMAGAVMQGLFRNPMADPGILGVSSGASLGAIIAIALKLSAGRMYVLPFFAAAGAIVTSVMIYTLASKEGRVPTLTLILSGVAISTFVSAISSLILTRIGESQLQEYLFWSVGSLKGLRYEHLKIITLPVLLLTVCLAAHARPLNILLLGEEEAQSLGLNPHHIRTRLLLLSSLLTALAVSVSGTISFVGLIVPHIMRLIVGPDQRILLPCSAIGGAVFLVLCDLAARTVAMPSEIGIGIVTALLGAPYFVLLLRRARKEGVVI